MAQGVGPELSASITKRNESNIIKQHNNMNYCIPFNGNSEY
jgi:hypothetical protein